MPLQFISSPKAPKAVGPYSQAVRSGDLVFLSGQIGLNPDTGKLVSEEFVPQAEQVFANLAAVLEEAGCAFSDVAKLTIYLASMQDYPEVNRIMARVFGDHKPARATFAVAELPLRALVEVEAIACVPSQ